MAQWYPPKGSQIVETDGQPIRRRPEIPQTRFLAKKKAEHPLKVISDRWGPPNGEHHTWAETVTATWGDCPAG